MLGRKEQILHEKVKSSLSTSMVNSSSSRENSGFLLNTQVLDIPIIYLNNNCSSCLPPEMKFLTGSHPPYTSLDGNSRREQLSISSPCKMHPEIGLDTKCSS